MLRSRGITKILGADMGRLFEPQRRRDAELEMFELDDERARINQVTDRIIGCAIEVHKGLGPGLLESAYEECLCFELSQCGVRFKRQVPLPVIYKGVKLDCSYIMDIVVDDLVILEIKAVEKLIPVHDAQLLSYLKMNRKKVGLLLNFNVPVLKHGLKRIVNNF